MILTTGVIQDLQQTIDFLVEASELPFSLIIVGIGNGDFKDNPDIYTVNNILKTYHECIEQNKLTFAGPTYFPPLIRTVISKIDKKNIFEYHILMILTDGVIEDKDLQDTKDILVEASFLPLSVIIIGIGNEDFTKMEILDADVEPLRSKTGQVWLRDIVQFVPFNKYQNNPELSSKEVLAKIPSQMVKYYYKLKNYKLLE